MKLKTNDGTETFFNEEYQEAYHSTKAGAYLESLHKFVTPCKIKELSKTKKEINILDVGFGLGYNVAVALEQALEVNPDVRLNVISIEKDISVFEKIKELNVPEKLKEIYKILNSGNIKNEKINYEEILVYFVENKNLNLKVILEEGRKTIKLLQKYPIKFDAVFWDAFSPKVNTEMWTVDIFRLIKNIINEEGIFATYSASLAVRKGLLEAGFQIGLVEPIGRKSYSTVATINGEIPPLTEREKERLENSPFSIPYRDLDFKLPIEKIKENWEKEINQRGIKNENKRTA
jgi:chorismate dehydratase